MNHLPATKSKRQFYRVLHNAAEEAVREIESVERICKKRKVVDNCIQTYENDSTNFNILQNYLIEERSIDTSEDESTQNNTYNKSNLYSSFDCINDEDVDIFPNFSSHDENCRTVSRFHDLISENADDICKEKNMNAYLIILYSFQISSKLLL